MATTNNYKVDMLWTPELIALYESAGLRPTGKGVDLIKSNSDRYPSLIEEIRKGLRILDEANAVQRYRAYNIPANISSEELERMLYYKGQICMFYCKELKEFFFMPFALD